MDVGKSDLFDEAARFGKFPVALAGEADDHVGAEVQTVDAALGVQYEIGVFRRRIMAVHAFEHRVAAVLKREVQKAAHLGEACHGVDQSAVFSRGFGGTDADAEIARQGGDRLQQIGETLFARRVGAGVDAGQYELREAGFERLAAVREHLGKVAGARRSAQRRHDAVRAMVVAPLLDLDERAAPERETRQPALPKHPVGAGGLGRRFAAQYGGETAFCGVAADEVGSGAEHALFIGGGGAPDGDDPRRRIFAAEFPQGLTRLAFGFGGHGAGVDDQHVGRFRLRRPKSALRERGVQQRAVGGVEPTAERDDPGIPDHFFVRHARAPVGHASMHLPHSAHEAGNPALNAVPM